MSVDERFLEEVLCLPTQSALHDDAKTASELVFLSSRNLTIIDATEDFSEGREIADQRAEWIHELDEAPELR